MSIKGVRLQLNDCQGNVGAVVGHTLKICQQIIENKALIQRAHAPLQPLDVMALHLIAQGVHDLLQGLYPACA